MKLFVAQIRQLSLCNGIDDSHCLYGHPITRAEVVGTIVAVKSKATLGVCAMIMRASAGGLVSTAAQIV